MALVLTVAAALDARPAAFGAASESPAGPLRLHPRSHRCLLYRGKAVRILTSAEHYGAAVHADFDYRAYLEEMRRTGQNGTRVFTFYRENARHVPGPYGSNTLAPTPEASVLPWLRVPGHGKAADGLNKFDLDRWNPKYFDRMKDYLKVADAHGVLCEIVLFSNPYSNKYPLFPCNRINNVNGVGGLIEDPKEFMTLKDPSITAFQERFIRKMAVELNGFDNIYYEICNEPNVHGNFTEAKEREVVAWTARMARTLRLAEEGLAKRHLIAANAHYEVKLPNGRLRHEDGAYLANPDIDLINYHYLSSKDEARGLEFVRVSHRRAGLIWRFLRERDAFRKPIVLDETYSGIVNGDPEQYAVSRAEAWETILGGAAGYSNLDWTFTPSDERGSGRTPIGDGRQLDGRPLREWLNVFRQLLAGYDLAALQPASGVFPDRVPGYASAGSRTPGGRYILYFVNEDLYFLKPCPRRELRVTLTLPKGRYAARVFDTRTGATAKLPDVKSAGTAVLAIPAVEEDIAVLLERRPAATK